MFDFKIFAASIPIMLGGAVLLFSNTAAFRRHIFDAKAPPFINRGFGIKFKKQGVCGPAAIPLLLLHWNGDEEMKSAFQKFTDQDKAFCGF